LSRFIVGEPAPWFRAPSPINPQFSFQSLGGRYLLLAFLPPAGAERDAALAQITAPAQAFDDENRAFFGVLPDAESFAEARNEPPFRWFADVDGELRRLFGSVEADGSLKPQWFIIDPSMRILGWAPLDQGAAVVARFARLGAADDHAAVPLHAPVLIVPRVFETAFCQRLIELYEAGGGAPSGVMQVRDGKTVGVFNDMKRRRDATIEDPDLISGIRARVSRRLLPEIAKAFQFTATRIERYIVACYGAAEGGYFRPHRDNTTPGTAHRKFAVSINLNAEAFEGGDLRFPEFGSRTYRPPTGGAVVFSCSLLHEATPVTRGLRYACLPFLYDEAGAKVRQANLHTFAPDPAGDSAPSEADPVSP
jgi:predicted 2-oxoglutarate/Fe(II)-dependent dioxygenase YbiX/peroxiredoxin